MSKLFKTIGIGAAIGTLAYVILKYKKDQKFKEKVDEKKEEVKKEAQKVGEKALDKACSFTVNHPKAALGIVTGTFIGGTVLGTLLVAKGARACNDKFMSMAKMPVMTEEQRQQMDIWSKENGYDDNLETVKEFVKTVSLHDNEVFGFTQYNDENGERKTCVYQGCRKDNRPYERVDYI